MIKLPITCIAASGESFQANFELHPQTRSPEDVGMLTDALLATITDIVQERGNVSDGDVLQALAMTLAIRSHVVAAPATTVRHLIHDLVDTAHNALDAATPVSEGQT